MSTKYEYKLILKKLPQNKFLKEESFLKEVTGKLQ